MYTIEGPLKPLGPPQHCGIERFGPPETPRTTTVLWYRGVVRFSLENSRSEFLQTGALKAAVALHFHAKQRNETTKQNETERQKGRQLGGLRGATAPTPEKFRGATAPTPYEI